MERRDRKVVVYDLETILDCFTYTDINIDTNKVTQFVICDFRNELEEFISYIKSLKGMVGFNSIGFDYPIVHAIIRHEVNTANEIYQKAQEIINIQDENRFKMRIPEWEYICPQLDLFAINHFSNPAKRTSLKDLEFWMNYPNVQDMPIKHNERIKTKEEVQTVLDYNLNDVMATLKFYELNSGKIQLRKQLSKQYNLKLINADDPKIGSEIILNSLAGSMNIDKRELRKLRTYRDKIVLNECILPFIEFKTLEFNRLLKELKETIITGTKDSFDESVIFKGFKYVYGTGGIHGCIIPGVYESDQESVIIDADVGSLYPSISVLNNFAPEHLGQSFVKVYGEMVRERMEAKKSGDKVKSEGLKLGLNGSYGLRFNNNLTYNICI